MMSSDELNTIIERIASGTQTVTDVEALRVALSDRRQDLRQLGKYNVNIAQGQDIHIGDRTYVTWNDEAIQALIEVVQKLQSMTQTPTPQLASVDELVQQVRSRLHDDIQCLHGTMPLWGVDRWVPLGELFVDVNILEELSSSRKSELDDLWQDFTTGMQGYSSYRSLDRIGLGKERKRVSGLEVLAKNTNLMIVGKPGSGKTTYLQRVVTECNAGNLQAHRIPVLIKLREFVEDGREVAYSLERYLERCWRLSNAETQLVLDQGRALVLLDGLDEVTGEDGKNIAKEIKRFARAYPQVQVIVTCRTQSHESRFERFDYVEVADFNEPQVRAFAEHWFKTVMGDELAGLARAQEFLGLLFLEENKPIRELAITPILLSLTCAVFHQTGKFYSKRSKLYEEGLELLLEQWDKSREIERDEIYRDLSVERKLELLSYLAVKKFEQEQYVLFEQGELEGYIGEFLRIGQRDSRVVLKAIEAQHGLLIERSQKVWSFSHLTFQEYFVARRIIGKSHFEQLLENLTKKEWREIFLLTTSMTQKADQFIIYMNAKIDELLSSNQKFQQFLEWINKKSSVFAIPYNSESIRAFYFYRSCKFDSMLACRLDSQLSSDLDFDHIFDDYYIELELDIELTAVFALGYIRIQNYALKLKPEVHKQLHKLKSRVLNMYHERFREFKKYWQLNTTPLVEQLAKVIFGEYSSDVKWHFNDKEKYILQEYYYANNLLLDCINNNSSISTTAKKDIKKNILLPIAKIEQGKRGIAE
ncbi:MAG: NACHT domain-containing protein [Symplocastrum torsivum CPER-KK1]|jgi:predicted NACHT family NTPase|uniref:NACHT domain-containing protein n=1 Tax=Symplocastrum torsivum CPER-KK1 TaxID=450513 RepID=A0A951UCK3_9CYAN|nr:NACHT domain-containing protein [Symplocastrum torsivum CPER-KK1]